MPAAWEKATTLNYKTELFKRKDADKLFAFINADSDNNLLLKRH